MSRARMDWVVMGPEPYLAHCTRCGGTIDKPTLPAPISMAVAWMRAGVELHRACKPKAELAAGVGHSRRRD